MDTSLTVTKERVAELITVAVAHYWMTRKAQALKQRELSLADAGVRGEVTGGAHLNGFASVLRTITIEAGYSQDDIYASTKLELPGYFRPTKKWDLVVVRGGQLIAAVELKAQAGPSFGNNLNNRTEEAIGSAVDLNTAYREGAFGNQNPPFLGWVFMLEDCPPAKSIVRVNEPHFRVFEEFRSTSYADRYRILCQKLVREKQYTRAAFLTSPSATTGEYSEPEENLSMLSFLAAYQAHLIAARVS